MTPTTIFSTSKVFKAYLLNELMKEGEARTRRPTNASSEGHGLGFAHIVLPVNWVAHKAAPELATHSHHTGTGEVLITGSHRVGSKLSGQ